MLQIKSQHLTWVGPKIQNAKQTLFWVADISSTENAVVEYCTIS